MTKYEKSPKNTEKEFQLPLFVFIIFASIANDLKKLTEKWIWD